LYRYFKGKQSECPVNTGFRFYSLIQLIKYFTNLPLAVWSIFAEKQARNFDDKFKQPQFYDAESNFRIIQTE